MLENCPPDVLVLLCSSTFCRSSFRVCHDYGIVLLWHFDLFDQALSVMCLRDRIAGEERTSLGNVN